MLRRGKGFTIIEMLIVVAIVSILAAIALPAYNEYVNRSRIRTAQADLVALSLIFENIFQRRMAFPAGGHANTAAIRNDGAFAAWGPASDVGLFNFTTDAAGPQSYLLRATGMAGGVAGCVITIDNRGATAINSCAFAGDGRWL